MPDKALERFVAFAFSAADILIETDLDGRIVFSAGALSSVKTLASAPAGWALAEFFEPVSRGLIRALAQNAPDEGRAGPVSVWCEDRAFDLSLWRMEGSDSLQWALRPSRNERRSDVEPFAAHARNVLKHAQANGDALSLSMIWLDGAERIRPALGDREADQFFESLNEIALMHAQDGAAGRIEGAGEILGLVAGETDWQARLEAEIDEIAGDLGLERVSARTASLPATDGPIDTMIEVFLEAATRFHDTGIAPDDATLAANVEKALRIAEARTRAVTLTVRNKLFEPYVQPLADSETLDPCEYEILVRLPGGRSFFPGLIVAEQSGIVQDIDLAMCEAALQFLNACPERPSLSLNMSAASLLSEGFSDRLAALLTTTRIDPGRLCFEITETRAISDFEAAQAVTEGLRRRGHPLALDDFGSGAAGVEYLMRLPVDRMKIDGALVPTRTPTEWERGVFKSMAGMAKDLGVTVVAERVEHRWQAVMLAQAGIDLLQGYLFGEPEPLSDLASRHSPVGRRTDGPIETFG